MGMPSRQPRRICCLQRWSGIAFLCLPVAFAKASSHRRGGSGVVTGRVQDSTADDENRWSPKPPIFQVDIGDGKEHNTLYSPKGPVARLVGREGMDMVTSDPDTIWFVEFYSAGCPHCWYFAPIYVTLAKAFSADKVKFGAFNCLDLANVKECLGVGEYPSIHIYNLPKVDFTFIQDGLCSEGLIADKTGSEPTVSGCAARCKDTSECGYFSYSSQSHDCGLYLQSSSCVATTRTGYRSYVMKALANPENPLHVEVEQPNAQPISAKALAESLTQQQAAGALAVTNPVALEEGMDVSGANLIKPNGVPGRPGWPNEQAGSVDSRRHDALIGAGKLLMDGYTDTSKFEAAKSVIAFLAKVFPENNAGFDALYMKLQAPGSDDVATFKDTVNKWMTPFDVKFQFCFSKPCSVWELLHVVTVAVAGVQLSGAKLFLQTSKPDVTVKETMGMVRTMVANFLDCAACRDHFVTSYDGCYFGRCEVLDPENEKDRAKAMVLWLWRTHDAVSVRVISENPPPPKIGSIDRRWPPYRDCPGCWKYEVVVNHDLGAVQKWKGEKDDTQPTYDIFDESRVLEYLFRLYLGQDSIKGSILSDYAADNKRFVQSSKPLWLKSSPLMLAFFACLALAILALICFPVSCFRGRPYESVDTAEKEQVELRSAITE